jgi:hypothetical protein
MVQRCDVLTADVQIVILIAGIVLIVIGVALLARTVQMWRNSASIREHPSTQSPVPAIYWTAVHRSLLVISGATLVGGLVCILSIFDSPDVVRAVLAFTWFCLIVLGVIVVATNRPRFLVPPTLRLLPGAIEEERRSRGK